MTNTLAVTVHHDVIMWLILRVPQFNCIYVIIVILDLNYYIIGSIDFEGDDMFKGHKSTT